MHRLVAVVALLAGCVGTTYSFTPSTKGEIARQPGCEFQIVDTAPEAAFEEVGRLDHYNGPVPKSVDALRSAIKDRVCQVGGDVVIADPDPKGEYKTVTVVKLNQRIQP